MSRLNTAIDVRKLTKYNNKLVTIFHHFSKAIPTDEAIFKEDSYSSTGFYTYASFKFYKAQVYDTYIAIRRNGQVKKGRSTERHQHSAHFLSMPISTKC